jgi:putative endonuclease
MTAPEAGRWGEDWAAWHYFHHRGAAILHRNWRDGQNEIDLVLREADRLVFCEVKVRSAADPEPLSAVRDPRRIRHLRSAAISYYQTLSLPRPRVRFDALLVTPDPERPRDPQINVLEEIYTTEGVV